MKVGTNNKRNVIILSVLAVVGAYVLWTNVFSSPANDDVPKTAANHPPPQVVQHVAASSDASQRKRAGQNRFGAEWNPVYKTGAPIDPIKVDPTLRLDILTKVQKVEIEADAQRSLFQYGTAPAPLNKDPLPSVAKIGGIKHPMGPQPPPAPAPPPTDPTAPPIALKYYGFATPRSSGNKRAFFLDNDDIIVAAEGELIKRRYKLVKIGVNSVTMEDTQFKSQQQTLPLAPDATS
jgi:hypothetical protein